MESVPPKFGSIDEELEFYHNRFRQEERRTPSTKEIISEIQVTWLDDDKFWDIERLIDETDDEYNWRRTKNFFKDHVMHIYHAVARGHFPGFCVGSFIAWLTVGDGC
ncbi:hypothetical protein HYALB_00004071 [Hymenoscyphus albidus]|uniref:Uncharacterized protein n=1 Tax=Hymenoscyphus albidus TaxID=595503 RepID=A0A9N9Q894_9HELO|nr:hypothetical protein HYALB_00004071 [Hymenoscyphus albidus]